MADESPSCCVCGGDHLTRLGRPRATPVARSVTPGWEQMQVVRCGSCGAYAVSPAPRWDEAALQRLYGEEYFAPVPPIWQRQRERLDPDRRLDEIARALPATASRTSLLDVGCGPGYVLARGLARGWAVTGVEPSRYWAEHTAARLGVTVHAASVETCELPAASFDVVFADSVIEHLVAPIALLGLARRVLREHGLLYLVTPNADGLASRFRHLAYRALGSGRAGFVEPLSPPYHLVGLTPGSLEKLAGRAGLRVVRSRVVGGREELLKQGRWLSAGGLKDAALIPSLLLGEALGRGTTIEALLARE
jgi:SAM-dependent methyltransferase